MDSRIASLSWLLCYAINRRLSYIYHRGEKLLKYGSTRRDYTHVWKSCTVMRKHAWNRLLGRYWKLDDKMGNTGEGEHFTRMALEYLEVDLICWSYEGGRNGAAITPNISRLPLVESAAKTQGIYTPQRHDRGLMSVFTKLKWISLRFHDSRNAFSARAHWRRCTCKKQSKMRVKSTIILDSKVIGVYFNGSDEGKSSTITHTATYTPSLTSWTDAANQLSNRAK